LAIHQGRAVTCDVSQEDTDLTVIDLAQPTAPLTLDAAGGGALLGEAAGIDDQDGLVAAPGLGDVAAQLGGDGLVVPGAGADEVLHGLTGPVGLVGDGLGGLALQVAELALHDNLGQLALLDAVEAGEVACQEVAQAVAAAANIGCGDVGIGEQGLSRGVLQDSGHKNPLTMPPRSDYPQDSCLARKNGYSRSRV
jgi:hypothetical protein